MGQWVKKYSPEEYIIGEGGLVSHGESQWAELRVPEPAEGGHLAETLVDPLQVLQHRRGSRHEKEAPKD